MTRLVPTRDRTQATRYKSWELAERAIPNGVQGAPSPVGFTGKYVVMVLMPEPHFRFWSGPWYLLEASP